MDGASVESSAERVEPLLGRFCRVISTEDRYGNSASAAFTDVMQLPQERPCTVS